MKGIDHEISRHEEKKRKYYASQSFVAPQAKEFVMERWWTIYEAVYALTRWPDFGVFNIFSSFDPEIKMDRSLFHVTHSDDLFSSHQPAQDEIYQAMKADIESGDLEAKFYPMIEGVRYLLRPWDVIVWALVKGYPLPMDLQEAMEMYQLPDTRLSLPTQKKIQRKLFAQFLIDQNPRVTVTEIIDTFLDRLCGPKYSNSKDGTAIRRDVNELYSEKGRRGRRKKSETDIPRVYHPKPIQEILQTYLDGKRHYHFEALRIAMELSTHMAIGSLGIQKVSNMTQKEVWDYIQNNAVVRLYLEGASKNVFAFAHLFAVRVLQFILKKSAKFSLLKNLPENSKN